MSAMPAADRPMTAPDFAAAKGQRKLTVLTAYDYTTARLFDAAGVDAILVGDSLGMIVQGHKDCLRVTLDEMIYHTRCVARGAKRALVIGDMPFLSFQLSPEQALANAGRLVKESDAQAVKLEGGERTVAAIERIVAAGVPVMAHIGLTPQSVRQFGGFKVQRDAERLKADARAVESAGAFSVVVECVPTDLAGEISEQIRIPTIGIGAGPKCDGQVLVGADMLGQFDDVRPKFAKRFGELGAAIRQAAEAYCRDVRTGAFPGPEHSFR